MSANVSIHAACQPLLLLLLLDSAGCVLFRDDGQACETEANCPDGLGCCDGTCKSDCGTAVILSISSEVPVTVLSLFARNIDGDKERWVPDLGGRDLTGEPFAWTIEPSATLTERFLVIATGGNGATTVARDSGLFAFTTGRRLQASLTLRPSLTDADGDGFPSCAEPGCDCNDQNEAINPFTREKCGDQLDNNCSGLPVDEGCPCSPAGATRACTTLPFVDQPELKPFVGIGWCKFGTQICPSGVWQTECVGGGNTPVPEIPDNGIDDNCNGAVDEGSACTSNTTRPCLLGRISTGPAGYNFDGIAYGVQGSGIRCRTGVQQCNASGRWENACVGEVRPQRDPSWVGFVELPAGTDPSSVETPPSGDCEPTDCVWRSTMGQCDGVDNDCDGLVDEEPWFDSDQTQPTVDYPDGQPSPDGYTYCGTNIDTQGGTIPVTDPRSKVAGLSADFIDCDDSNPSINPGAIEICGNAVDEDCRCNHDSLNRPATDPNSEIGKPYNSVYGFVLGVQTAPTCSPTYAFLDCTRLPRSDQQPVGLCAGGTAAETVCQDGATLLYVDCPHYYHGYFGPTGTNAACYYCAEQFGYGCNTTTGACTTQAEDCTLCDAPTPPPGEMLAAARPLCMTAAIVGCTADQPASFTPVPAGQDPNDECPGSDCNGAGACQ